MKYIIIIILILTGCAGKYQPTNISPAILTIKNPCETKGYEITVKTPIWKGLRSLTVLEDHIEPLEEKSFTVDGGIFYYVTLDPDNDWRDRRWSGTIHIRQTITLPNQFKWWQADPYKDEPDFNFPVRGLLEILLR